MIKSISDGIRGIFGDFFGLILLALVIVPLSIIKGCDFNKETTILEMKNFQEFQLQCLDHCDGSVVMTSVNGYRSPYCDCHESCKEE